MSGSMRLYFSVCLLALSSGPVYADNLDNYLLDGWVETSEVDGNLGSAQEPWVDSTEVRMKMERDERGEDKQGISFRFRPRLEGEQSSAQSVFELRRQHLLLNEKEMSEQGMQKRYLTLIDVAELRARSESLEKRIELLRAESDLMQAGKASPDQLQNVVLKLVSAQSELEFTRQKLSTMKTRLNGGKGFDANKIMTPPQIAAVLKTKKASFIAAPSAFQVQKAELEAEMASSEFDLAYAKKGLGVSTMEVSYDNEDNSSRSVMLGVQIPFGLKSDPVIRDRLADRHEAKANLRQAQQAVHVGIQDKIDVLESLVIYWQAQQKLYETLDAGFDRIKDSNEAALVLTLNQQKLSVDEDMAEIRFRMLRDYIELLHISGFLTEAPLRNWLLPETPVMVASHAR